MNRPTDPRTEASSATPSTGNNSPAMRNPDGSPRSTPALRATSPTPIRRPETSSQPAIRRPADGPRYGTSGGEGRRMVVAKDITLAGQISKCDYLVVEGSVEGMRYDGQALEVTEGGTFNGSIEVDSAEIAGTFDGVVVVRGRLTIRPTGRITGTIRYGEIEINAGGQVNGELQGMQPTARPASSVSSFSDNSSNDDLESPMGERLAGE